MNIGKFQTTTEERQSMIECAVKEVHDRLVAAGKKMMEDLVLLDDRISVKCHAVDEHVSTHVEDLQKVVLHVQEQAVERGEVEALTEYLAKEFKHVDNAMGVVKVQVLVYYRNSEYDFLNVFVYSFFSKQGVTISFRIYTYRPTISIIHYKACA